MRISVRPARRTVRGRTPFAVLVVALLSAGLIGLLMLNTALNEGSFELARLKKQTTEQTDQQQTLQQQIDLQSAPDALERRARELGMVPGGDPAFLQDDGKVLGKPAQATDAPPVKRSGNELWQQTAAPTAQPAPGASPTDPGVEIAPLSPAPPAPGATPTPGSTPTPGGTAR